MNAAVGLTDGLGLDGDRCICVIPRHIDSDTLAERKRVFHDLHITQECQYGQPCLTVPLKVTKINNVFNLDIYCFLLIDTEWQRQIESRCDSWKSTPPPFPSITVYSNGIQSVTDSAAAVDADAAAQCGYSLNITEGTCKTPYSEITVQEAPFLHKNASSSLYLSYNFIVD